MAQLPLAHISWAIADNKDRAACDAFFTDVFGAERVFEILITPENENSGLDREERLIFFTEKTLPHYPPLGSKILEPAQFPIVA